MKFLRNLIPLLANPVELFYCALALVAISVLFAAELGGTTAVGAVLCFWGQLLLGLSILALLVITIYFIVIRFRK